MTMIDVDTSPLEAAREWRGIGLVAAAMTSGLPVAQAEALEEGDPSAFGSVDEMIAAAVVYGASLGIGRDEAVALLDRTVCRVGAQVRLPAFDDAVRPNARFSGAVQERSGRIADRDEVRLPGEHIEEPAPMPARRELGERASASAAVEAPLPEHALAASAELELDEEFGPDAPWERSAGTGELEAWADDLREDEELVVGPVHARQDGLVARARRGTHALLVRLLGPERALELTRSVSGAGARSRELLRDGRARLARSEHATLFAAIGGGAVLIALLVAIGGALGGSEPAGPGPAERTPAVEEPAFDAPEPVAVDATSEPAPSSTPAPAAAMLPPARVTLDIFNAGSQKGHAREVAAKLDAAGYRIGEVTNAKSDYSGDTIIHPRDMLREAKLLARRTGISTLQVAPGTTRRITIVVT